MDNEVFVLYLLKNAFHKVQSSTKDTEEESSSIKKRKKTRKPLMFLAAIDRSVWSLFFIIVHNSFTSLTFQERLREFGGERAAILKYTQENR